SWTVPYDDSGRNVATRTVTVDGQSLTTTYVGGSPYSSVIDPLGNETTYTYALLRSGFRDWSVRETNHEFYQLTDTKYYQGPAAAGTLLKTVHTDYAPTNTILPFRETTTWAAGNLVSKVETDYDSFAVWSGNISWKNPVAKREYDFGSGAPGAL